MKFGHNVVDESVGDIFHIFGSGIDEAGSGDVVNESGDAAGIIVNDRFCFCIEELIGSVSAPETMIDVSGGLVFGQRIDTKANGNAIHEIGVGGAFKKEGKRILSAEDYFKGKGRMGAGADKEAQVGQGLGGDEMCLVDNQDSKQIVLIDTIDELEEKAVFTEFGSFAERGND
jgi:hypothetical protein